MSPLVHSKSTIISSSAPKRASGSPMSSRRLRYSTSEMKRRLIDSELLGAQGVAIHRRRRPTSERQFKD